METNTKEKSLIKANDNNVFNKIKNFFSKLFQKSNNSISSSEINKSQNDNGYANTENDVQRNAFVESLKVEESEESKLLALQNKYRNGEIKEEDMTPEQVSALCKLYDKQISELKQSNELKRRKIQAKLGNQ